MITELFSGLGWAADVPCTKVSPDRFFPDRAGHSNSAFRRLAGEAQSLCGQCSMRRECAKRALDGDDRYGVWAGVYLSSQYPVERMLAVAELQRIAGVA